MFNYLFNLDDYFCLKPTNQPNQTMPFTFSRCLFRSELAPSKLHCQLRTTEFTIYQLYNICGSYVKHIYEDRYEYISFSVYEYSDFFFKETAWRDLRVFSSERSFFEVPCLICDVTSALDKITHISMKSQFRFSAMLTLELYRVRHKNINLQFVFT